MTDKRNHPAVLRFNQMAKGIIKESNEAETNPDLDIDPETYVMPTSMMRGMQIDADQLDDLPPSAN